jgi:hypothetical protein
MFFSFRSRREPIGMGLIGSPNFRYFLRPADPQFTAFY